jgi:hypothetical protein
MPDRRRSMLSGHPGLLMALPLLAVTALAAGCGGSAKTSSASTTTAPAAGTPATAARAKFTSCLEAHGVPASEAAQGFGFRRGAGSSTPSSTVTPPTTSAAFAAAFQACRSDLPARFGNGGLQNTAAGRAYLQCLQLHGVTLPSTPPTSAGGSPAGTAPTPGGAFRSLSSNPAYQAARTACAALAPARGSGPNGVSSTSSSSAAG